MNLFLLKEEIIEFIH